MTDSVRYPRRTFLKQTALGGATLTGIGGILYSRQAPAIISAESARPNASWGLSEAIVNVVWLTADVHYCAAHFYDPGKAQFKDFDAFWEFVAGPLNAGTFGPNALDNTFGPQLVFQKVPAVANTAPSGGYQFFGQVDIDARSKDFVVSLKDIDGATVFSKRLPAQAPKRGLWSGDED